MLFCAVLAVAHSLSSGGLVQAHGLNYHLFAEDPHISIATQLSFLSPHFYANCHIHCIPQTLQINVSKIELSFPPLSSQVAPASPTFTFILVSVGGTTIQKFTSHIRLPSLSPTFNQPLSLASFSSSIFPNLPFVLVLLCRLFQQPSDCFSCL